MTYPEDIIRLCSSDALEFAAMTALVHKVVELEMAVRSALHILDKPRIECRDLDLFGTNIGPVLDAHHELAEFLKTLSAIRHGLEAGMKSWAERKDRDMFDLANS